MSAIDLRLPPAPYPAWRRWRRTRRPAGGALNLVARWIERARQRDALSALDDRLLRDIGVTRVEAARECGKPFWR